MIHNNTIERIKSSISIEKAIKSYSFVELRARGNTLVGRCPFHNERTPSFVVWPESGRWKCFGCGAGGDVIDFVARALGLSLGESVKHLAGKLGISGDGNQAKVYAGERLKKQLLERKLEAFVNEEFRWLAQLERIAELVIASIKEPKDLERDEVSLAFKMRTLLDFLLGEMTFGNDRQRLNAAVAGRRWIV